MADETVCDVLDGASAIPEAMLFFFDKNKNMHTLSFPSVESSIFVGLLLAFAGFMPIATTRGKQGSFFLFNGEDRITEIKNVHDDDISPILEGWKEQALAELDLITFQPKTVKYSEAKPAKRSKIIVN